MDYRKAMVKDIRSISYLVTELLGTCNINSNKNILESNIEEISKDIENYYVCVIDDKVIGACGISSLQKQDNYNLGLTNIREILYLVVDKEYQNNGIGTKLLELCSYKNDNDIIYEAWGDNGKKEGINMYIYRCCSDEEILQYKNNKKYIPQYKSTGSNTFNYDGQLYIHFFLFAENAELFQEVKNNRCVKNIIQCNMDYEELTKCLGYGFYSRVIPGFYTPVPEFKIRVKDFKVHTIKNISRTIKDEWKREDVYQKYKTILPHKYLADYETGAFRKGYGENSILEFDIDSFISINIIKRDKNDFER